MIPGSWVIPRNRDRNRMKEQRGTAIGQAYRRIAKYPPVNNYRLRAEYFVYGKQEGSQESVKGPEDYRYGEIPDRLKIPDGHALGFLDRSRRLDRDRAAGQQGREDQQLPGVPSGAGRGQTDGQSAEHWGGDQIRAERFLHRPYLPAPHVRQRPAKACRQRTGDAEDGHRHPRQGREQHAGERLISL